MSKEGEWMASDRELDWVMVVYGFMEIFAVRSVC